MLRGLDLFSGYGGISIGLRKYVRPITYCEIESYAQGILISRMEDEHIPFAPIWNDVTTLDGKQFKGLVDMLYCGFPCQDISVAGHGKGLEGKRSGLFYEIIRITKEARPAFVFLENVPAIRTRGLQEVLRAFTKVGYDCRWTCLSAASVGANHRRERWFLLAKARQPANGPSENSCSRDIESIQSKLFIPNSDLQRCSGQTFTSEKENYEGVGEGDGWSVSTATDSDWWSIEPDVGRVANGVALRSHRIKALGNGVIPLQVEKAFERLMGL